MSRQRHRLSIDLHRHAIGSGAGELSELARLARRVGFFPLPAVSIRPCRSVAAGPDSSVEPAPPEAHPLPRGALHSTVAKTHLAQLPSASLAAPGVAHSGRNLPGAPARESDIPNRRRPVR